jgi:hypothetical protein
MKNKILIIITFLIIVIVSYFYIQKNAVLKLIEDQKTAVYYIDVPADLDEKGFESIITLDKSKQFHYIAFPTRGTSTSITINDSNYLSEITNNTEKKPLIEGQWKNDEKAQLDISKLKLGKYYIHYLSCNIGGVFPLYIK